MSWARAALERNKDVEIVTADQESRTFTVRVKDSKELIKVRVDELVAVPAGVASAPAATLASAAAAPASAATEPAPVTASATPGERASADGDAATPDSSRVVATEGSGGAPQLEQPGGRVLSAGPGYSIKAAAGGAGASRLGSGKLSESGPGYSMQSVAGAPAAAQRTRDPSVTSAALERRHEPIVCQGSRLLQIDNRNLQFDGDAVSAEDGCEIHITNSHITATGIGVQARAANVHIDNSSIEGNTASIDASDGAQVYAAGSHFTGMNRQLDTASFHDLGGNIWN
jgi:hypothetical protein